jgi:hypothetical protein
MGIPKKPAKEQPLLRDRSNAERSADVVKRKALYLKAYGEFGNVRGATEAIGISRQTYRRWVREDPDFMRDVEDAKQEFGEYLEGIALERVKNPDKGKGSDVLLIFLLNGTMPWKYRPQIAMSEDSAKELILEWRKAAQDVKAEAVSEPLPAGVEQTLTELLDKRGSAPVKDEEEENG